MTKSITYLTLVAVIMITACATKAPVWTPVGNWDYTVKNTPNGDGFGTIIITEENDVLSGILRSSEFGDSPITNLVVSEGQLTGDLFISGIDMKVSGTFEGEVLTGSVDAGQYGQFPLTANRLTEQ